MVIFSKISQRYIKIEPSGCPLGRSIGVGSDLLGRPVEITDAAGEVSRITYDAKGRITQSQDALGRTTRYGYDAGGNLLWVQDGKGNTHWYGYDENNRVRAWEDPLGKTTYLDSYDSRGNLKHKGDRKGQNTWYGYDALNRLTRIVYNDSSYTDYTWDSGNRLVRVQNVVGGNIKNTLVNTWDANDRLTEQQSDGRSVRYTYYSNGLRKTMSADNQPTLTYNWDNADRLIRIEQAAGSLNNGRIQSIYIAYENDRRKQVQLANGQTINYGYDAAGQLIEITYKNTGGSILGNLTYQYDNNGRRTKIGGSLARLNSAADVTHTVTAGNRLTNHNGKTLTYDGNGNLTGDGVNTYTWNARNQLIEIRNSGGTITAQYTYDALGRRQTKTINGSTTRYVYDGANIVQELDGSTIKAVYLAGGLDENFAQQTGSGATAKMLNYWTDALGSTIRLTDATGSAVADYTYDLYGGTSIELAAGATVNNPFQYTGRENDGNGLYYYRNRYYSPGLQRFISEDPIGFAGGANFYRYVGNSPANWADPLGLSPADIDRIYNSFRKTVDEMTKNGERLPLYLFNNAFAYARDDDNKFWPRALAGTLSDMFLDGQSTLVCGQQWERVEKELDRLKLDDAWKFTSDWDPERGHAVGIGASSNSNDPKLIIDPWKDRFVIEYPSSKIK